MANSLEVDDLGLAVGQVATNEYVEDVLMGDTHILQQGVGIDFLVPSCDIVSPEPCRYQRALAAQSHKQPRRSPYLHMSEYLGFVVLNCSQAMPVDPKLRTSSAAMSLPMGSRLLQLYVNGEWKKVSDLQHLCLQECPLCRCKWGSGKGCDEVKCKYGIYRSYAQWHEEAKMKLFPMDVACSLKAWQIKALTRMLTLSPLQLIEHRKFVVNWLINIVKKHQVDEDKFQEKKPNHIKLVCKLKRILTMKSLVQAIKKDYQFLENGLMHGFDLTSELGMSGWFPAAQEPTRPTLSREDLLRSSTRLIHEVITSGCSPGPCQDVAALHDVTMQEVVKGWAKGPLTANELDMQYGVGRWCPAHRFGIHQSSAGRTKLRPIDDFTVHGHNSCAGACEQLDIGGLDEIIAISRALGAAMQTGTLDVRDIQGVRTCISINPDWVGRNLVIRSLDLKSAYKQLPVSERDLCCSIVYTNKPDSDGVLFWQLFSLPFGSVSSVYAFNAYSRMIEVALCELCAIPVSSYFDDFVAFDTDTTSNSASHSMEALLDALGWEFDKDGDKHNEFGKDKIILGASVQVLEEGLKIGNTQTRLAQIEEEVGDIIARSSWTASIASKVMGRLNFARSLVSGRPLQTAMWTLSQRASGGRRQENLTSDELKALEAIQRYTRVAVPRTIPFLPSQASAILYTDGSVEDGRARYGAVLFLEGARPRVIQEEVPQYLVDEWFRLGSKHCIAQTELIPVLKAKQTWKNQLRDVDLLHYTDNEAVRGALIRGSTSSLASRDLLQQILLCELELQGRTWVSRIPSESNPADLPSRGRWKELIEPFACIKDICA